MTSTKKTLSVLLMLVCCLETCSAGQVANKRSAVEPLPTTPCTEDNQGHLWTYPHHTPLSTVWFCQDTTWVPHQVLPSTGKTPHVAANSCKHVRDTLTTHCSGPPLTGTYWLNLTDTCTQGVDSMRLYCEMSLDGGGWTLVWKHSYMEVGPLSEQMKYFSNHHRPCSDIESGWCNVPHKARLQPSEMMIVAYRNKRPRFAYKGWFNYNIDYNWRGGILVEPKKLLDECTFTSWSQGKEPAPSASGGDHRLLGIAFDKVTPSKFLADCVTILGQYSSPGDCRWADCDNWDSPFAKTQMTMAIFVR